MIDEGLKQNYKKFTLMLEESLSFLGDEEIARGLQSAAMFASSKGIGSFNSWELEKGLLSIAQKNSCDNASCDVEKDSFLHVFTTAYGTGGHTRVCERWIENSANHEKHSVVLIDQGEEVVPDKIKLVTRKKNGKTIFLKSNTLIDRAMELRSIASSYDKIILHIHMHDVVPVIAFGSKEFKRPVIFFNHADHIFWIGVSISDIVANLRTIAQEVSIKCRGVKNNFLLPLPIEKEGEIDIEEKNKFKTSLNIPLDAKVILTLASDYKYRSFGDYDFVKTISKILRSNENAYFLAIGPDKKNIYWKPLQDKFGNRVIFTGLIENHKLSSYLAISDLAIDSFPFGSFTSLLDIGKYGIRSFSLKTPVNDCDTFFDAGVYFDDQRSLIKGLDRSLKHDRGKDEDFVNSIRKMHFPGPFAANLTRLYNNTPEHHYVVEFVNDKMEDEFVDFKNFVYEMQKKSIDVKFCNSLKKRINKIKKCIKL